MNGEKQTVVLVVDDDDFVRESVSDILSMNGYLVLRTSSAQGGLAAFTQNAVDVVLTDIKMPGATGVELLGDIRKVDPQVPVILMTAYAELDMAIDAIRKGAFDFITKPYKSEYLLHTIAKAAQYYRLVKMEKEYETVLEETVRNKTEELTHALAVARGISQELVQRLTAVAESRDAGTGIHTQRIGLYARILASALDLPGDFIKTIKFASALHDIGKIGISDEILLKSGALSVDEFETIKCHTVLGKKILSGSSHATLKMAASIAENHHEKWDGSGYPRGIKGDSIPIEGRIVIICDQYDALRSQRPYKGPLSHEEALAILTNGDKRSAPHHFDPDVFEAFKRSAALFGEVFLKYNGKPVEKAVEQPR